MSIGQKEADREILERLLDESKGIKGVSLWQDAGKRLRRNKAAMASIVCLAVLAT